MRHQHGGCIKSDSILHLYLNKSTQLVFIMYGHGWVIIRLYVPNVSYYVVDVHVKSCLHGRTLFPAAALTAVRASGMNHNKMRCGQLIWRVKIHTCSFFVRAPSICGSIGISCCFLWYVLVTCNIDNWCVI